MTLRRLYAGPRYSRLETAAFERLARRVGDQPDSLLYLARNDHAERQTRDRWRKHGSPLSLTVDTFDGVVARCHERDSYAGHDTHVDEPLRNRLVELAVERLDGSTNPFASNGRLPAAGLCQRVENLLSLVEFADLHSPDAIRARLREEDLPHQAETVAAVAAAFDAVRDDLLDDSSNKSLRAERYTRVLTSDTPLSERFPSADAVVLGGFSLFSPLERQLVEQITETWPTVALLSQVTDSDEALGIDRGGDRALRAYLNLGFEREYVTPDEARTGHVATPRQMYRHGGAAATTTGHADVDFVRPETIPRELRHVARDVRARIADGTAPEDLGIVLTDTSAYHERLVETLERYEVPATLAIDRSFAETALGEVIAELAAVSREDPTLDSVTTLLSNPLVTIGRENPDLDRRELTRVASRLTSRRLASAYDHLDDDTAWTVRTIVDDARALRTASLADLPEKLDALVDRLGVPDSIDDLPESPRGRTEKRAADGLDRTLETLAITDGIADLDRGDVVDRLDRALSGLSLDAETARQDGHVLVRDLEEVAPHEFEHAYVLGLTTGHFPSNPERLAFTRPINEAHEDFQETDVQQRARYHFGVLLASDASLTLSVPERALEGDPYVEADVVTEFRRLTDRAPDPVTAADTTPGCREDVQRSLGETFARDETDEYAPQIDRAADAGTFADSRRQRLHAGVTCAAARASDELSPHDGQLSPETVATLHGPDTREPFSPSRLETYATCGFRYYVGEVLDIEEPDEVGLEPDARDRGGYVHDVLEHYYADLRSTPGDHVESTADRAERESRLLDVALERLDERFDGKSTTFQARWLRGVLAGLGDPDANPYYGHDRYGTPEEGLLVRFLDHEIEEVGRATARPAWFEARIGKSRDGDVPLREDPVIVETPAGEVPVHGMIDRVDVVPETDPKQLVVRDYKTGGAPSEDDTLGGVAFQLPVYARLAEAVFDGVETVGGSYYQVSPPGDVNHRKGLIGGTDNVDYGTTDGADAPLTAWRYPTFETHDAFRGFIDGEIPNRLGQLAEGITGGQYHPTVLDPRDAGCRYCGYSDVCDVRPHRRRDVIESLDEDGDPAYIPLAARDRELEDVLEVE